VWLIEGIRVRLKLNERGQYNRTGRWPNSSPAYGSVLAMERRFKSPRPD